MSIREIARRCNISKSTVQRIDTMQLVESRRTGRCGRKRKTSPAADRRILRSAKTEQWKSLGQLRGEAEASGVRVCKATIWNRIKEVGGKSVKPRKVPVLTPAMKQKRLDFARAHAAWTVEDWRRVSYCVHFINGLIFIS